MFGQLATPSAVALRWRRLQTPGSLGFVLQQIHLQNEL